MISRDMAESDHDAIQVSPCQSSRVAVIGFPMAATLTKQLAVVLSKESVGVHPLARVSTAAAVVMTIEDKSATARKADRIRFFIKFTPFHRPIHKTEKGGKFGHFKIIFL